MPYWHGGYLAAVTHRRPGLSHTVDRLRQEHTALLAEGDALHALLNAATDLPARVLRLLDRLARHELAEQDLVQRAVIDDLGTGD